MKDIKRNPRFKQISNRQFGKEKNIPFTIIIKIWFSDVLNVIGAIFLLFSIPFVLIFVPIATVFAPSVSESDPTVKGKITEVHGTNASINDMPVYEYVYKYSPSDGGHYEGIGYSTGQKFREGAPIMVKYKRNQAEISEVKELRNSTFSAGAGFIVLIFPLIGGILMFFGTKKAINSIMILKVGELAYGKFLHKTPTNTRVNNQMVYKLTFEFTANNGKVYEAIAKTHQYQRLLDEEQEQLVYDPDAPENAVMLDALPKSVKKYLTNQ
jgi:hypothetical protein